MFFSFLFFLGGWGGVAVFVNPVVKSKKYFIEVCDKPNPVQL